MRPGYKQTEVGVIPEDWYVVSIADMGDVISGKALAARAPGAKRPYLRTKNVLDGRIALDDVLSMPMTPAEFSRFRIQRGDVLLNEGQTRELVGRCALYDGELGRPCAMQNQLLRFRANKGVSGDYSAHVFRLCQRNGVFGEIATQTTSVAHLGLKRFQRLRLAWAPTLAEQEAIATALSDVDALIEATERLIAKKRHIKQGAMQALLTGKRRLPGFEVKPGFKQTEIGQIPEDWNSIPLGSLARQVVRGASPRPIASPVWFDEKSDIGWVRISDVTKSGRFLYETTQRLSAAGVQNSRFVKTGSLIMSICATVGRPIQTLLDICIHDGFVVFENPVVQQEFLYHQLAALEPTWADRGQTGSQMNLNTGLIKKTQVAVPSQKAEQEAIATVLSDMDGELQALTTKLTKTRQIKQGMMRELLTGRIRLI